MHTSTKLLKHKAFRAYGYSLYYPSAGTCRKYLNLSWYWKTIIIWSPILNYHQFCEILSEQKLEILNYSTPEHSNDLEAVVKIYCNFCSSASILKILSIRTAFNHYYPNTKYLWKSAFAEDLKMFLSEFNQKLQG